MPARLGQAVTGSRWNVHLYSFIGNNKSLTHGTESDLQVSFQAAINLSLLSEFHLLIFQKHSLLSP